MNIVLSNELAAQSDQTSFASANPNVQKPKTSTFPYSTHILSNLPYLLEYGADQKS